VISVAAPLAAAETPRPTQLIVTRRRGAHPAQRTPRTPFIAIAPVLV
jgi:hypothetical protein